MGRCKSFEASADGYGRGEGIAVLALAPAQPEQRSVALLRGSAVNQDGQSSSLTAPNGPSQTRLVRRALAHGGLAAANLRFVAVHGTGTPLGDPIEVGALGQALRGGSSGSSPNPLVLGSVKSCYGHTEGTAGVTGLLLAIQAAAQGASAPVMHLRNLNPYVQAALGDWSKSAGLAASVPRQAQAVDLQQMAGSHGGPLVAGTSSFGMSGVNAHVVVDASNTSVSGSTDTVRRLVHSYRSWPLPALHPLLSGVASAGGGCVLFGCSLQQASLAYLQQHEMMGRRVLPAAAALELLAAGCQALQGAPDQVAVAGAVLAGSVHLDVATPTALTARVDLSTGRLELFGGTALCASAHAALAPLVQAAQQGQQDDPAPLGWLAGLATARAKEGGSSPAAVASIAAELVEQQQGYACHPALGTAAMHRAAGPDAVRGCDLYRPHGCASSGSDIAVGASLSVAHLCSGHLPLLEVHGLHRLPALAHQQDQLAAAASWPGWQLHWQPTDVAELHSVPAPATVLVVSTTPCPLEHLCSSMGEQPALCAVNAVWGDADAPASSNWTTAELCVGSEAHLQLLVDACEVEHCIVAHTAGSASAWEPARPAVHAALATYRVLLARQGPVQPRISLVTFGAEELSAADAVGCPSAALLLGEWPSPGPDGCASGHRVPLERATPLHAGLHRTLFMEDRPRYAPSLDLPVAKSALPCGTQLARLLAAPGEFALAVRAGRSYSLRLVRAHKARPRPAGHIASALVTGGSKGLGLEYCRSLAARGCRLLVVTSRSGAMDPEALGELAAAGCTVISAKADSGAGVEEHSMCCHSGLCCPLITLPAHPTLLPRQCC